MSDRSRRQPSPPFPLIRDQWHIWTLPDEEHNYGVAVNVEAEMHIRRSDRWSLRLRLWRSWHLGRRERRHVLLGAANDAAVGHRIAGIEQRADGAMAYAGVRLDGGRTLTFGRCHRPTLSRLALAISAGPVVVERIADHRHCFGVYLRTVFGPLALLAPQVIVGAGGGGLRVAPQMAMA